MMFGSAKKLSLREHEQALSQAQYQLASLEALRKGSAATLHDLQAQLQGTRVNPLLSLSLSLCLLAHQQRWWLWDSTRLVGGNLCIPATTPMTTPTETRPSRLQPPRKCSAHSPPPRARFPSSSSKKSDSCKRLKSTFARLPHLIVDAPVLSRSPLLPLSMDTLREMRPVDTRHSPYRQFITLVSRCRRCRITAMFCIPVFLSLSLFLSMYVCGAGR